jgi:hypothetical protein
MFGQGFNYGFLGKPPCFTDTTDIFKDNSGVALYTLDYDASDSGGASGKFGEAAIFNGSSSKIELPSALSDGSTTDTGCISFWFNVGAEVTSSTTSNEIMQFAGTSSLTGKIALGSTSGHMSGETFSVTHNVSGVYTYSTTNIPAGWNHAVVQWNSGTGKWDIYINGTAHTTYTVGTNAQGKFKLKFGNRSSFYYKGRLDQIRIFNKSLSSSEVTTLYNETKNTTNTLQILGDTSCIATYSFDGSSTDLSGNYNGTDANILYKYDGTPTNVDFGVGGKSLYSARFNGSSSYIDLGTNSPLNNFNGEQTISAWIYPTTAIQQGIIGYRDDSTLKWNYLRVNSNRTLSFLLRNGSSISSPSTTGLVNLNAWNHVCVTVNSSNIIFYINGGTAESSSNTVSSFTSTEPTDIGRRGSYSDQYFNGSIDQVRIFNKALSPAEISKLYGNGAGEIACTYTSTTDNIAYPIANTAYYKLDNTAEDETGNYDGAATNVNYTFGRFGQAAVFNGSSSTIELSGGDMGLTFGSSASYSISLWFQYTTSISTWTRMFNTCGVGGSQANQIAVSIYQSKIAIYRRIDTSTSVTYQFSSVLESYKWYNAVFTVNGTTVKLYLNGVEDTLSAGSSTSISSVSNIIFGSHGYSPYFNGLIDQIRIFSTALTSAQISQLYNEKPETDTSNFKTVLYEGTGSTQFISNVGMDLETDGGLLWIKNRDTTDSHALVDSVRGISESGSNYIASDSTSQELSSTNMPSSLEKSGFFVQGGGGRTNTNNESYVAWVWKGGGDAVAGTGTGVTNVSVSANTEAGFSIVKFTGGSGSGQTVEHGLNEEPEIYFLKGLDNGTDSWIVCGNSTIFSSPTTNYLRLNTTASVGSTTANSVGSNGDDINVGVRNYNGQETVGYCFHSVSGISSIGSYSGTSSSGNAITGLGFQPNWLMVKRTDANGNSWLIVDNKRVESNGNLSELFADTTSAESGSGYDIDFTSDGFTLNTTTTNANASGTNNYIYMAFK